jgi:two-component system, cell cycle response regulator DivK
MSKRILVVEDQSDNRQIIRDMLAPTDYEISEAENGQEALAAIAKQRPDLILMDIQLPIMDGYEATRRIKADASLRSIPIIAVTSYALSGEGQKARVAGCDDYVPKPFSFYGDDRKHPSRLRAIYCGSRYSEFAVPQLGHFRPARI